jgi:hypothetical protein
MTSADRPPTEAEIARLAHDIWEAEGRPSGRHLEHWRRAQAILAGPSAGPVRPRKAPTASRERPPGPAGAPYAEAPEVPGARNPEPIPPTNDEGYVTVPSDSDTAAGALGDAPPPPPAKPSRQGKAER